jgi:hypothetical protein
VQHQREVATAIKTARELALLPYSVRSASDRVGGRGRGGGPRGEPQERAAAEPVEAPVEGDEGEEAGALDETEVSDVVAAEDER